MHMYNNIGLTALNPIRSGGGGGSFITSPLPPSFCSHRFNIGATKYIIVRWGRFTNKKTVLHRVKKKILKEGYDLA